MDFLQEAIKQAKIAGEKDEVPVGAVIVKNGEIIARAHNQVEELNDPTAHAEILAIKTACSQLGSKRIPGCELYTTLEPCPMCAGAILHARLKSITYAAKDFKWGADGSILSFIQSNTFNHHCASEFIPSHEYSESIKQFFKNKRNS
ncbi:tRNA-specific adenosine deaminase [Candidatus Marinamargulisbacteria bacterium SCGC AAA071-K20]|nr:tRNA-specific adenosine deaminase [Candidatus Marinamargulisbacteria bacterium SCGC AAA071-K20]